MIGGETLPESLRQLQKMWVCFWKASTTVTCWAMSNPICFLCLWLLLWHRVAAVEMQESPSHNFGQLAVEPLESTSRCCVDSFLVVNSPLTPSHQPQLQSQVNWSRLKDGGRRKETSVRQEKGWVGPGWGEGRRQTNHDYLLHKEGKFRLFRFAYFSSMTSNARTCARIQFLGLTKRDCLPSQLYFILFDKPAFSTQPYLRDLSKEREKRKWQFLTPVRWVFCFSQ